MFLKNNAITNLFKYTWKYSKKKWLLGFILLSVIANISGLMTPIIIGKIFNTIQLSSNTPNLLSQLTFYLSFLIILPLIFWAFQGPSRIIERANGFLVRKKYRKDMFEKVMALPAQWHIDHHSGDTIDKIKKASDNLFNFSSKIFLIISAAINLIGSISILLFFDWHSSLVAFAVSGIAVVIIIILDKKIKKRHDQIFKLENYLSAGIYDYISNIITIITLRLRKKAIADIEERDMKSYLIFNERNKISEIKWFLASFLIAIMTFLALTLNAYTSYQATGVILIGTLFTLYQYLKNIGNVFYHFANQYGEMIHQDAAIKGAETIIRDYDNFTVKNKPRRIANIKKWKTIQLKNISFTYQNEQNTKNKKHIDNISFSIARGEKIAFIGASGSGKSTVLSLLRGLFDAEKAETYFDGKLIETGLAFIGNNTALIPQEPEIFNTTILENITMGTQNDKKYLQKAIKISQFKNVITRLKKGIKTNIMEKGISLSGGEKQRLALARGLYLCKKYDFLLLDEPTSSVDSENELKIYQNIFAEYKNKSIISSIHRLHLLKYFDYIYFFDNGKIITEGTFKTLLEEREFKILWDAYINEGNRK